MKTGLYLLLILLIFLLGTGCDSSSRKETSLPSDSNGDREKSRETIPIIVKDTTAYVEVVYNEEGRKRGLMFRKSLPENEGMLFIFPKEEVQHFWMKNTLIPLSTAFFNRAGHIVRIVDMIPEGNVPDWRLESYGSDIPATYVLEMEYGWFEKHGIQRGDKVTLPESILSIVPE